MLKDARMRNGLSSVHRSIETVSASMQVKVVKERYNGERMITGQLGLKKYSSRNGAKGISSSN